MPSISQTRPFVVGVDTHARNHVYSIIETATGTLVETRDFPTTANGLSRAVTWVGKRTGGDLAVLWVIEGCASYGANIARQAVAVGFDVAEAPRYDTAGRRGVVGKTDPLDAERIARATLPLTDSQLRRPREDSGARAALRVLTTARYGMTTERTSAVNALTAIVRAFDLGLNARYKLTGKQILEVSRWRIREEPIAAGTARAEAIRLAKKIIGLDTELVENKKTIKEMVHASPARGLLDKPGIGPINAAIAYVVWSHRGRIHSEAAFAAIAGASPIPASSGNTTRHRLSRSGDRRLNNALHIAAVTRMRVDPETKTYVEKRRAEGRTDREIRRCIKRYLARQIYRYLNAATATMPASTIWQNLTSPAT